jgi:hypothetical protein
MPYITQERRAEVDFGGAELMVGDLNYLISTLLDDYIGPTISYAKINDVIGVLECAKMELYRRLAVDYENEKAHLNGDVYRQR